MAPEPVSQEPTIDVHDPRVRAAIDRYWRRNLLIMAVLLIVWALAGLILPIVFAEPLNQINWAGFPLAFWIFQQGSIITFVLIILVYAILLNRLDDQHHRELADIARQQSAEQKS
jgi:putative solute:sodium symporter small subunit